MYGFLFSDIRTVCSRAGLCDLVHAYSLCPVTITASLSMTQAVFVGTYGCNERWHVG